MIWFKNAQPAVEYELRQRRPDYRYLIGELANLAGKFSQWIDENLVNHSDPLIRAERRAFVSWYLCSAGRVADWSLLNEGYPGPAGEIRTVYIRIKKLLGGSGGLLGR